MKTLWVNIHAMPSLDSMPWRFVMDIDLSELAGLTDEDIINVAKTRNSKFEAYKAWRIERVYIFT
jgi:hypothetical protein